VHPQIKSWLRLCPAGFKEAVSQQGEWKREGDARKKKGDDDVQ